MPGIPNIPCNFWTYKNGLLGSGIAGADGPGRGVSTPDGWPEDLPVDGWPVYPLGGGFDTSVEGAWWYFSMDEDEAKYSHLSGQPNLNPFGSEVPPVKVDGYWGYTDNSDDDENYEAPHNAAVPGDPGGVVGNDLRVSQAIYCQITAMAQGLLDGTGVYEIGAGVRFFNDTSHNNNLIIVGAYFTDNRSRVSAKVFVKNGPTFYVDMGPADGSDVPMFIQMAVERVGANFERRLWLNDVLVHTDQRTQISFDTPSGSRFLSWVYVNEYTWPDGDYRRFYVRDVMGYSMGL